MRPQIIKKAIISEKAYKHMDKSIYTFLTDKSATKKDVAEAVKKAFSVDVIKVNITPISQKKKRVNKTRKFVEVGGGKKALVWLKSGQTISALSPKAESKKTDKKIQKTDKKDKS